MLKIRLKRLGSKKNPTYRIIVINATTKREGRPVQELGHYNPKTKVMKLDKVSALEWISKGNGLYGRRGGSTEFSRKPLWSN